jgi:hypothetical protein
MSSAFSPINLQFGTWRTDRLPLEKVKSSTPPCTTKLCTGPGFEILTFSKATFLRVHVFEEILLILIVWTKLLEKCFRIRRSHDKNLCSKDPGVDWVELSWWPGIRLAHWTFRHLNQTYNLEILFQHWLFLSMLRISLGMAPICTPPT